MHSTPIAVVVNDDPTQLSLLEALLTREGLVAYPCGSVDEALSVMNRVGIPDLIVTDLYMPGIDGWRFCRLLRSAEFQAFNRVPILVVSATYTGDQTRGITAELGANAFIESPFQAEELSAVVRHLLQGEYREQTADVVVVEDSAPDNLILCQTFERRGFQVHSARDAASARALFQKRLPDLALIDYHLPDAQGDELLSEIKKTCSRTLVIMMTYNPTPELATHFLRLGASAYVHKPFDPDYIIALADSLSRAHSLLQVEDLLAERTRSLRESELRYRALFTEMVSGCALFKVERSDNGNIAGYQILDVNRTFEQLMNVRRENLVGHPATEAFPETRDPWSSFFNSVIISGNSAHFEQTFPSIGKHFEIAVYCPAPDQLAISLQDITQQRNAEEQRHRMERQLQEAQRLESLGVLAGGIAHDFNNILTAVIGNANLCRLELPDSSPASPYLEQIESAAMRAADLCKQMLTYAGRGRFVLKLFNLSRLVEETKPLLESCFSKKAELNFHLMNQLPEIEADVNQMRQILLNLVTNAAEALGDNAGMVTIGTAYQKVDASFLSKITFIGQLHEGDYVCLEVRDTGCGMSSQIQSRVFEPFFHHQIYRTRLGPACDAGHCSRSRRSDPGGKPDQSWHRLSGLFALCHSR